MVSEIKNFSNIDETFTANSVAIIILVLGCLIFLVAFIGCCGAIQENSCALSTVKCLIFLPKHFSYGFVSCFSNLVLHHHVGSVSVSNRPNRLCLDKPCTNTRVPWYCCTKDLGPEEFGCQTDGYPSKICKLQIGILIWLSFVMSLLNTPAEMLRIAQVLRLRFDYSRFLLWFTYERIVQRNFCDVQTWL